jgi:hypothetical protein
MCYISRMSETLTPDDPRAARNARLIAMLDRANDIAIAQMERAEAASLADAAEGKRDEAMEDLRSKAHERACKTLRRNGAFMDRLEIGDVAIAGRIREIQRETRKAIRGRARDVERAMLDAIVAGDHPPEAQERLYAGLNDWIERHAWDEDFADEPIRTLVRMACDDLGFELTYEDTDTNVSIQVISLPAGDMPLTEDDPSEPVCAHPACAQDAAKPP